MAEREAAHHAEELARLEHQRQCDEMERRELQEQFGHEDEMARREIDHQFALKNDKSQAELDEMRERQDAYDAAFARLHAPLAAGNRQDKHDLKWEHVFSAADMRPREVRDTFSTESFGHKFHADGKPIPAPPTQAPPSPKPATEIQEGAARVETISDASTMHSRANLQDAKATKRNPKPRRKEKRNHAHSQSHSPAELLQSMEITRNLTLVRTINEHELGGSDSEADAVSQITRLTNIAKLVDDSTFHDDTLCQLLDAARLNLIGDQAKKALMRAARTRVDELSRELLEREASPGTATPPLVIRKKNKKKSSAEPGVTANASPAAVVAPLPPPVNPVPATTPLPTSPLSAQPTAGTSPSPSKNEEVITEVSEPCVSRS